MNNVVGGLDWDGVVDPGLQGGWMRGWVAGLSL